MNSPSASSASPVASSESSSLAERALADTFRWLERAVVGLNLCPFAKGVLARRQVHVAVCESGDDRAMIESFERELDDLVARSAEDRDTTLLVLPNGMEDFLLFCDLHARAGRLVRQRRLEGVIQVANFHPHYVFAGEDEDAIGNRTNRSPHPTLHLLREASIDRAVAAFPDPAAIYEANIATLERLGAEGWRALGVGPSSP